MGKPTFYVCIILILSFLGLQVGVAVAAPVSQESAPITGTVHSITLETDPSTGILIVSVKVISAETKQTLRLDQETALDLGFVTLDADGKPVINPLALGTMVEIDPAALLPAREDSHPVGNALATLFSDITDYDTIMAAHEQGLGFGVITQALWLASELDGGAELFQDLLDAKLNNDYGAFAEFTEDGTAPKNWGQLRNALLDGKNLGSVMSDGDLGNPNQTNPDKNNNGNGNGQDKDKDSNGNGAGQDQDKDNNGNGNGQDKDKDK